MNYFLSSEAETELAEAIAFLTEFTRAAQLVATNPGLGTSTSRERRIFPLHRFPYSIVYRAGEEGIRIGAVAHHRRRPSYWQTRT